MKPSRPKHHAPSGYRGKGQPDRPARPGQRADPSQKPRPKYKPKDAPSGQGYGKPRDDRRDDRRDKPRGEQGGFAEGRPGKRGDRPYQKPGQYRPKDKPYGKSRDDARDAPRGDRSPQQPQKYRPKDKPYGKPRDDARDAPRSAAPERAEAPAGKWIDQPYRKPHKYRPTNKPYGKPREDAREPKPAARAPEPKAALKPRGQMLYGLHAVREAWLNPKRRCHQLWLSETMAEAFAATLAEAAARKIPRPAPTSAEKSAIDQLLPGAVHQGIALAAEPLPEIALEDFLTQRPRCLVVLDQVTDPHNVGAILRSAAAFGASAVILTERHAPGTTGTMAKSASGALEHVALIPVVNLARAIDQLREAGIWCVGLAEEGARMIGDCDFSGPTALVMGAEGEGLRRLTRERCDELAKLPTGGAVGTLNVSNAAAVALYEVKKQDKPAS